MLGVARVIESRSKHMSLTKIAVAIPTYKRPKLLQRLIDSVPPDWHAFVSDNDSSLALTDRSFGKNVTVSHSPSLVGMFANWNRALSMVSSEYSHVFVPSDDDLFLPNVQFVVEDVLERFPDFDIFIFGCDLFDETGRTRRGYKPRKLKTFDSGGGFLEFETGVDARMPGILFRCDFLGRVGSFDESMELTAADSELVQRALLLGRSVFVPQVIGLYQTWNGSLTSAHQATDMWLNEVSYWTGKIAALLHSGHQPRSKTVNVDRYRDEIFTRNLLAGVSNLQQKGEFENARAFLARHPVPRNIRLLTRLRTIKMYWLLWRGLA